MRIPLEQLAQQALAGDHRSLQELFVHLYPLIFKHIAFMLRFHHQTEDATQEAMSAIYQALPSFAGRSRLTTWALTIASRTARRHAAKEIKRRALPLNDQLLSTAYGRDPAHTAVELVELNCFVKLLFRSR